MLSISKEIIAELPAVEYPGQCHLIESASAARDAVRYMMKLPRVGFDTETRPSFQKGKMNKVALLQLATGTECFLFRLNKIGITEHIKTLLENRDVMKIGLSTKDDFQAMRRLDPSLNPDGFLELQTWVKKFDILDNSLQKIFAIIFDLRISKTQRLTNWEADELTDSQQQYAAIDAWACLEIYNHLEAGNFHPEISKYKMSEE